MYVIATGRLALLLGRGLALIRGYTRTIIIIGAVDAENTISVRVIDEYRGSVCLRIIIWHIVKSIFCETFLQILGLQMRWRHLWDHIRLRLHYNTDIVQIYRVVHGHTVPVRFDLRNLGRRPVMWGDFRVFRRWAMRATGAFLSGWRS